MIRTFRHRGLKELFERGNTSRIEKRLHARIIRRLDYLDAARAPKDMNVPGFNFHKLHGKPVRYTVHVNGPWCITFSFDDGDAFDVDLENYH